ncbi:MAG: molybdopterin-dependent oxidoreductase, partial [Thermoanaerobaculia bacterium]
MKPRSLITRRGAILTGLAAAAGGLVLPRFLKNAPPTFGNLLRMGDALTYSAHTRLLPGQSLAREYRPSDLTSFPATGTFDPAVSVKGELGTEYRRLQSGSFASWRLQVEGSVARPRTFSLDELRQLPSRTQITRHTCEEGWSAIGQWTGV